jgi:hypothetical protein
MFLDIISMFLIEECDAMHVVGLFWKDLSLCVHVSWLPVGYQSTYSHTTGHPRS